MNKDYRTLYSESMLDLIDNIVEVVVNSYFYWVSDAAFRQDLMQEGYLKAYELLRTGNYDPNQSLRNYLYTGVRNAMTNLNYHNNKEKHSSYDLYNDNIELNDYNTKEMFIQSEVYVDYNIDKNVIQKSCDKFNSSYFGNVVEYFNMLGVCNIKPQSKVEKPNSIVLKSIIVDIMWNIGG